MRPFLSLISILTAMSVNAAFGATDLCQDNLTGMNEILEHGAVHREQVLSNEMSPAVSALVRTQRALVVKEHSVETLGQSLVGRIGRLNDMTVAGEFVFGLDVLSRIDGELFTGILMRALESPQLHSARVTDVLVNRGSLILVSEKFGARSRLLFLRAVLNRAESRAAMLKIINAGQWIASALSTPGLRDMVTRTDLDLFCRIAHDLGQHEISTLSRGWIDPTLAEPQWRLARKLGVTTQNFIGRTSSTCAPHLAEALSTLDRLGAAHHFTPSE